MSDGDKDTGKETVDRKSTRLADPAPDKTDEDFEGHHKRGRSANEEAPSEISDDTSDFEGHMKRGR